MFLITRTVLYLLCTHIHVSSRTSAPTALGHAASPSLHGASCVPHLSPSLHGAACMHASQSVSSYLHGASCVQASQSVSTLHCMQPVCTHLRWFLNASQSASTRCILCAGISVRLYTMQPVCTHLRWFLKPMFLITRTVLCLLCTHIHVSSQTSAPAAFGHTASPSLHGASCVPHLSPSLHGAACVHASQSVSSYLHGASCV